MKRNFKLKKLSKDVFCWSSLQIDADWSAPANREVKSKLKALSYAGVAKKIQLTEQLYRYSNTND